MDKLDELRGEMQERLAHEIKQRNQGNGSADTSLDDYERAKAENPGEEVFALAVGVKCPNPECDTLYPVGMFLTYSMGEQFHFPCRKCDAILTLRDSVKTLNKNTFPVEKLQEKMRANEGKYETWINTLKAAYAELRNAGAQVMKDARTREHVLADGKGSKRPIKMRMTMQTPAEALAEMRPTKVTTGKHDHFTEMSHEGVADFFADPDLESKYKG